MNQLLVRHFLNINNAMILSLVQKVGNRLTKDGSTTWDPSKSYIKEAVKGFTKAFGGIDHIDLYQLHGGTIDDPLDETISAFDELKQEGIIRAYGISSIRPKCN